MKQTNPAPDDLAWTIQVPIFRNSLILKQLALAIGLPFGAVILFLFISSRPDNRIYAIYALGLVGLLFLLTCLLVWSLYGGKYDAGFVINQKGILCYTQSTQAKTNRIINGLTAVLGLASGQPTVTGAALLANAKQSTFLSWKDVRKVKFLPHQQTIMLRGAWTQRIALFCTPETYGPAEELLRRKITT